MRVGRPPRRNQSCARLAQFLHFPAILIIALPPHAGCRHPALENLRDSFFQHAHFMRKPLFRGKLS